MVETLQSVVQIIWPWADEALAWFNLKEPPSGVIDCYDPDANERGLAGKGFLHLLVRLRIILLQDSVFFRNEFPH
jgi:hypothetical protein